MKDSLLSSNIAHPQKLLTVKEITQYLSVQERTVRYYLNGSKKISYAYLENCEVAYSNHHTYKYALKPLMLN